MLLGRNELNKLSKSPLSLDDATRALSSRLWRDWLRPYTRGLIITTLLMVAVAAATAVYPILIRYVIDLVGAENSSIGAILPPVIIAIVVVTSVRGAALYFQTVMANSVILRVNADFQKTMFSHLAHADLAQITNHSTGSLISRFTNDLNFVRETLLRAANGLIRDAVTVVGLLGVMIYLDWLLTVVVLVIYPLAAAPIIEIGRRLRKSSTLTQEHMGGMTSLLNESFSGARMIRTYGLEKYETDKAAKTFDGLYALLMKIVRTRAQIEPIMEVLAGLAIGGVIAFGGYRIASGTSTAGDLAGFISALLLMAQPIRAIGTLNAVLQEGLAAVKRVFELLDEKPTIAEKSNASPLTVTDGRIELDQVDFSYDEGEGALSGVSLVVEPGKTTAIVGPSGAGKSTIFNLIPRLYDVSAGAIAIDGQDVSEMKMQSVRAAVALVSQEITIFNDTVRANIAFGRLDATDAEIEAAAKLAAAHDFISAMPNGYEAIVGDRGAKLSGGERQRIALARAVLKDAKILLLDEATSALDAESERQVQEALNRLTKGRTTLVIAHRLATVRNADQIYVLEGGRLVEQGKHEDLLRRDGLYARLCKLQYFGDGEPAENEIA
jgi:subfamily B ATP-binding cassette protein MsbA